TKGTGFVGSSTRDYINKQNCNTGGGSGGGGGGTPTDNNCLLGCTNPVGSGDGPNGAGGPNDPTLHVTVDGGSETRLHYTQGIKFDWNSTHADKVTYVLKRIDTNNPAYNPYIP